MRSARVRVAAFAAAVSLVALSACADSLTDPTTHGKRALKDTTTIEGDSTMCRSGYILVGGRIVCNGDQ